MKIIVQSTAFTRELAKTLPIASSKTTMPILQNVLLEAHADGRLSIHATDLEISLSTELSGESVSVEEPGRVAIRTKDLHDAVKNLKAEQLTLEKEDQEWVRLRSGSTQARFVGMNPDEFPQLPESTDLAYVGVTTDQLLRLIKLVSFSISRDSARPHLGGALVHITDDGKLGMVSTDGHRLSIASFETDATLPEAFEKGVIVPRRGLDALTRSFDRAIADVNVTVDGSNIVFAQDQTRLHIRLIEGNYPSYKQVVPQEHEERKAILDRSMFLDRLRFVALFSNSRTHNIRVTLSEGDCAISAQDPDKGECEEHLPIAYSGPEVRAGFNYSYIVDVLNALESDEVSLEITDTLKPAVMHGLDNEEGDNATFIIMPMRL